MSLYLWIDLLILLFPLSLSFDQKIAFFRQWPAVIPAILITAVLFIIWDRIAFQRKDWWFNPRYIGKMRLFGLPLEEVLFFITIPYACIFVYACVKGYFSPVSFSIPPILFWILAVLLITIALVFRKRYYTFTLSLSAAFILVLQTVLFQDSLTNSAFWISLGITYIPFIISNGILTGIPVVEYNPAAILGIRVFSIPIEDFLYSYGLLAMNFLLTDQFLKLFQIH